MWRDHEIYMYLVLHQGGCIRVKGFKRERGGRRESKTKFEMKREGEIERIQECRFLLIFSFRSQYLNGIICTGSSTKWVLLIVVKRVELDTSYPGAVLETCKLTPGRRGISCFLLEGYRGPDLGKDSFI